MFCLALLLAFFAVFLEGEWEASCSEDSESDSYYLESFIYAVKTVYKGELYLAVQQIDLPPPNPRFFKLCAV
jgi:hypothetical protein